MTTSRPAPRPHFYVLLDRSGSMASMRDDVIGGFNHLLADQQAMGDDARFTIVQFDSQDPQEILVGAKRPSRIRPLSTRTFVPRGGTPLLDATGRVIAMAAVRAEHRAIAGKRPEAITIVTITDGMENQSREFTRAAILRLVEDKEARGWTFAYLGAGLDAYGEAGGLGYDTRSIQEWAADGAGAQAAFASTSAAMRTRRHKLATGAPVDVRDFYEGDKGAEVDKRRRGR